MNHELGSNALHRGSLLAAALAMLLSLGASATSYVMTTDRELLERADLVIVAHVVSIDPAPDVARPATDHLVEIERLISGFAPAGTLAVRLPGGLGTDGVALYVFGMPRLKIGDRAILFLRRSASGTYGVVEYALGAFREHRFSGAGGLALRDLGGAHTFKLPGDRQAAERARSHQPRDFERFVEWLGDAAAGSFREADYFTELPSGTTRVSAPYTLIETAPDVCGGIGGHWVRWNEFDRSEGVRIRANSAGQTGVPGGGFGEIQNAIRVWSHIGNSNVRLAYAGTTEISRAQASDQQNVILFEDPSNEIDGSFTGSGVLATTSAAIFCTVTSFLEGLAHPLAEIGIVTQDGSGERFFGRAGSPALSFAEVIAHELGHALGLAHSCGDDESPACAGAPALDEAIMRATAHNDGRGARLNSDDKAGLRFLYGLAPQTTPQAPAAPSDLTATATSTGEIGLTWVDNSANETGFEVEELSFATEWRTLDTFPANTTSLTVTGLDEAAYRRYRVRARNEAGTSGYSNDAGATTLATPGACIDSDTALCLNEDRFRFTIVFRTAQVLDGVAQLRRLSDNTAYAWFFNPSNVELVVKALDGCDINQHYWTFAGGLTNVELEITVVDTLTGMTRTHLNSADTPFLPVQDTSAFPGCDP